MLASKSESVTVMRHGPSSTKDIKTAARTDFKCLEFSLKVSQTLQSFKQCARPPSVSLLNPSNPRRYGKVFHCDLAFP